MDLLLACFLIAVAIFLFRLMRRSTVKKSVPDHISDSKTAFLLDDRRDADGHRSRQALPDRAFQQRRYRAHCLLYHRRPAVASGRLVCPRSAQSRE